MPLETLGILYFVFGVLQTKINTPAVATSLGFEHLNESNTMHSAHVYQYIPEQHLYCCSTSHNTTVLLEHAENVPDSQFCKSDVPNVSFETTKPKQTRA